jgi:hypothetical protein
VPMTCWAMTWCCVVFNIVDSLGDPITDAVVTFSWVVNAPGDYDFGCFWNPCCSTDPWSNFFYSVEYPDHEEISDIYRNMYLCTQPWDTIDIIVPWYIPPEPEPTCRPRYNSTEALIAKANCVCSWIGVIEIVDEDSWLTLFVIYDKCSSSEDSILWTDYQELMVVEDPNYLLSTINYLCENKKAI